MPRPELPSLSNPELTGGPPADAAKPDIDAVEDVYQTVDETGSLKAAARKLQQYGKMRGSEDDPEEAEYVAQKHQVPGSDNEEREEGLPEVIPLQEVIEGLWIGDLVAAMDKEGLEERGIVSSRCKRSPPGLS